MDDMWDEPGDLAWLNEEEEPEDMDLEHDEFYTPAPGEEEY